MLRYGGSIDEAGHQCDMVLMLASKFVWGAEWSGTHGIEVYLRQGRVQDALAKIPHWDSYKIRERLARK